MKPFAAALLLALVPAGAGAQDPFPSESSGPSGIRVDKALLTLIEQAEVPAREAGVLQSVKVREGDFVREGQALAQIDDVEAQLDKRKAQIDLEIARERGRNDVKVRLFRKASEVAWAQFRRSEAANKQFGGVVSKTELEKERLEAEKADLEIEQADHELTLEEFNVQLKENAYATAVRSVERRAITAPLAGLVVQVNRRHGEWVEPGESVLRILRMDRLRVEGLVSADLIIGDLKGRPVVFSATLPGGALAEFHGKVVFVSPEINNVDGVTHVWAEVDNPKLQLRPGMVGALTISTETVNTVDAAPRRPE